MAASSDADVILVGGGLAAGLIALKLREVRPDLRVAVVERAASLGAGHTWSCFESDVAPGARAMVEALASYRWSAYSVRFPQFERRLTTPYQTITAAGLHGAVSAAGVQLWLNAEAVELGEHDVLLACGRRLTGRAVIDARGPSDAHRLVLGHQKFVGLEVETARPHGLTGPTIMDATVPQTDGYRFLYLLPFSPTRVLIEDTRYADQARLDVEAVAADARAYAAARGWTIAEELRLEHGVLPVALAGDIHAFWRDARSAGPAARVGLRAALFHPTTGYSLPDAVRTAAQIAALPELCTAAVAACVEAASIQAWEARGFYRLLGRMLFRAAAPEHRYRVLERFHRLPTPLIERFYAGRSTRADKLRVLCGRPPVPLRAALGCLSESRLLSEAA